MARRGASTTWARLAWHRRRSAWRQTPRASRSNSRPDSGPGRPARSIRRARETPAGVRRSHQPAARRRRNGRSASARATTTRCSACRGRSSARSRGATICARAWARPKAGPVKRAALIRCMTASRVWPATSRTSLKVLTRPCGDWPRSRPARKRKYRHLARTSMPSRRRHARPSRPSTRAPHTRRCPTSPGVWVRCAPCARPWPAAR